MTDASKQGRASRAKGQRAERQVAALIADLTGWTIKRRVRQYAGDSDLEGVPGWCVEVKDRQQPTLAFVRDWWRQAVGQSFFSGGRPVLFYKRQAGQWRAVWPMGEHTDWEWTVEGSLEAWAEVARERLNARVCANRVAHDPAPRAAEIAQEAA